MERAEEDLPLDLIQVAQAQQQIVDRLIEQSELNRRQLEQLTERLNQTQELLHAEHSQLKLDYQRLSQETGQQLAEALGGRLQQQLEPSLVQLQNSSQAIHYNRSALQHLTHRFSLKTWGGASIIVMLCALTSTFILKYQLPSTETLDALWKRQHELTELIATLEAKYAQIPIRQCGPKRQPCILVDLEDAYTDSRGKNYVLVKK